MSSNDAPQSSETSLDSNAMSVGENEFVEMLTKFFNPFVDVKSPTDQMNCIRQSLGHFSTQLCRRELAEIYVEFIFSLFEKFLTTNGDVILNSLEFFAVRRLIRLNIPSIRNFVKEAARKPPALFEYLRHTHRHVITNKLTVSSCFLEIALLFDFVAVQRLLRYGVRFEIKYRTQPDFLPFLRLRGSEEIKAYFLDDERLLTSLGSHPISDDTRRLCFVCLPIGAVIRERIEWIPVFFKSLRLVFETITYPFITGKEISRLLDKTINHKNKEDFIRKICDYYVKEFPENLDTPQPRELKHLCRCQIRECLRKWKKLPHGVWSLPIPEKLKDYVLIQKKRNEHHPLYMSALSSTENPSLCQPCGSKRQKVV